MKIAFDVDQVRPGCVLLQAAMVREGRPQNFLDLFPSETWTLDPTGLAVYEVTEEQLQILSEMAIRRHYKKKGRK
jgi:hypothetical protein